MKNLTSIDTFSVENTIEKEQKKVKNVFKTNVLVPNKYFWERGRYRSGVSPTFPAGSLIRPDRQRSSMETFSVQQESSINYRKCPTNKTPAIFRLKTKMQNESEKQTKTQECNKIVS
jgi:hypothetical protein